MLRLLWRLTRGYRLRPWRSPYLRWRMETYWGLHADEIDCKTFLKFSWRHREDFRRYLKWASSNEKQSPMDAIKKKQPPMDADLRR